MINSRAKGAANERKLRDELKRLFPNLSGNIRRGQQYCGIDGQDVVGLPGVHIECKAQQKLSINNAIAQAVRDAKDGNVPAVFHKMNHKPWLVTVRLDDLLAFACKIFELQISEASRIFWENGNGHEFDSVLGKG